MIKIFLSHSWSQKDFVDEVANHIGKDFAIVDRFVFENGRNLEDEINNSLDNSNVFVMLISNESLNSDWCKYELSRFRDNLLDTQKAEFIPFLIDDTDINDTRIKNWIRKYLTSKYTNALMLSRVIRRRVCEVLWKAEPNLDAMSRIFFGRDNDVSEITSELNKSMNTDRRAIIVTGIPHIGRKRLLREVYVTRMTKNLHPSYDLYDISLSDHDSIEDFIEQLNDFVQVYDKTELKNKMASAEICQDLAVELINKVESYHERIRITDNKCIVTSYGIVADWFKDIINHPDLVKQVMLFIASSCSLSPKEKRENTKLQAHNIDVIGKKYLKEIFIAYAKNKGVKCSDDDLDFFINSLSGFPKQVYCIVDDIANDDLHTAKTDLKNIQAMYDNDLHMLYQVFAKDHDQIQVLQIMCRFDFISYDFLSQIYSKTNLDEILETFRFYSIYETFGSCNQYMRISPAFSDYIDRQRLKIKKEYEDRINELSANYISLSDADSLDLSQELFRIKEQIKNPIFRASTSYILPSYALKVIIDLYRKGDNENVINIAHKVLYDYKRNNYETIIYPIRYWMCLAYCKTQDKELFKELAHFSDYSYHFILGYYHRIGGNYPKAQQEFEKALSYKIGNNSRKYYKAEHELVICLMKQGRYNDALKLAEHCYCQDNSSPYFIEAYFRCYVRSQYPDKEILQTLITNMRHTSYSYNDVIIPTMEAELKYFVYRNIQEAISDLVGILKIRHSRDVNYTLDAFREICHRQNMDDTYKKIVNSTT